METGTSSMNQPSPSAQPGYVLPFSSIPSNSIHVSKTSVTEKDQSQFVPKLSFTQGRFRPKKRS